MKRACLGLAVAGALTVGGLSSAQAAPMLVLFHPVNATHAMMTMHTGGSAFIEYTQHDASIKVVTENLPPVRSLHGRYYVLWATTGSAMRTYAGTLTVQKAMAGGHFMIMDTMFNKLVISAEPTRHPMHPMGVRVLVANVMHH